MPGIHFRTVYGVARIRPYFLDGLGGEERGGDSAATGFWIAAFDGPPLLRGHPPSVAPEGMHQVFVTNKHVIDQRLIREDTSLRLSRVQIELRGLSRGLGPGLDVSPETRFFEVSNVEASLFVADTADCAIICDPAWSGEGGRYTPTALISETMLADLDAFRNGAVEICQPVSFIGFPSPDRNWWDEAWTLPIAREGSIASLPHVPFTNSQISTTDVTLVSGLSFTGSSGSPVLTHRKHVVDQVAEVLAASGEPVSFRIVEPLVVGIMSGHFMSGDGLPPMFRHGGLSYFTRSTTILELLARAKENGFRNPTPYEGLHSVRMARFQEPDGA